MVMQRPPGRRSYASGRRFGHPGRPRDRTVELLPNQGLVAKVLGSTAEHGDIAQLEGDGDMFQEGALPGVRLKQGELDLWQRQRKRHSRQSAATDDVDHPPDSFPR